MTEFQKRLDKLLDLYLNGHGDDEVKAAEEEVAKMFAEVEGDAESFIQLYKFLPAQLTVPYMAKALKLESESVQDAGIAKVIQASISSTNFPTTDVKKATLLALADCLEQQGKAKESQAALVTFLKEFKEGQKDKEFDLTAIAARVLLGHLKTGLELEMGTSWQFETVLALPAVKKLSESTAEHKSLLKLVIDLSAGDCEAVSSFIKSSDLVSKWELDAETLLIKSRLLALCSLCANGSVVPYDSIVKKLGIECSEIEGYIINAMTAGLLNGRIDSMAKAVQVKTVHRPVIEPETWAELGEKLLLWYSQVSKLVTTLDDVRVQQVKEDRESERIEANSRMK